jgi:sulfite reductase beta subunit-like hemoprotein
MPRWKKSDVETLRKLVCDREPWEVLAAKLQRSVDAVKMKAKRLGLSVVVEGGRGSTTTNDLPDELPSVEEILKVLARVLKALDQPGLEMSEIQRLQAMVATIRTYEGMLADYVHYREIEKKLVEMEAKYARLVKKQKA